MVSNIANPVDWAYGIRRLYLCRKARSPHTHLTRVLDMTLSLELWGMWSTPSLPLISGPLWPKRIRPDRIPFMDQIKEFNHLIVCKNDSNQIELLVFHSNIWNHLTMCWRQNPTKQQLYSHQPPITKTIKIRRTRHARHGWRNRDEIISDVLLWTPSHRRAKAGRPARTYIQQLCADTRCSPEDLSEAMDAREGGERGSVISVMIARWWWWWWWWWWWTVCKRISYVKSNY